MQDQRRFDDNARHLLEFTPKRLNQGFSDLDSATRKVPAGEIAVPHQQDFVGGAEHDSAHAERHRPCDEEAPMHQAQLQPFWKRRGHAADAPSPGVKLRVVFPFKQSYCRSVNGSRPFRLGGPPDETRTMSLTIR